MGDSVDVIQKKIYLGGATDAAWHGQVPDLRKLPCGSSFFESFGFQV